MPPPVSVILIRESPEQLTGSGCCGKLEGDDPMVTRQDVFGHCRSDQERLGVLHRSLREFFPPVDGQEQVAVVVVDPRNQPYLIPKLWRDVCIYRPGWREGFRTAFQLFSLPAIVVNGRVTSRRGGPLDPDSLCHEISQILNRPEALQPD